ncbi:hypothetical protein KDM41_18015 [bacterium]|nr:hypothetical protein [bacterium]
MIDILAVIALALVVVWDLYVYHGVIAPFLEERDAYDRSLLDPFAARRNWNRYCEIIAGEQGPAAARKARIEGHLLFWAIWILVVFIVFRSASATG